MERVVKTTLPFYLLMIITYYLLPSFLELVYIHRYLGKERHKYKFTYQITAFDLWQLSMYGIYGSMVGVCNIILQLPCYFWQQSFGEM